MRKGQLKPGGISHPRHTALPTPQHREKQECPCKLEDKTPKRSILHTQSHLRIEVFVILNKMKTKRHLLNTRVDRTEFHYELKQTTQLV